MRLCRRHSRCPIAALSDRAAIGHLLVGRVWPGSLAALAAWVAVVSPEVAHFPVPVAGRVAFGAAAVGQVVDAVTARTRIATLAVTAAALWGRAASLLIAPGPVTADLPELAAADLVAAAGAWATLLLAATIIHLLAAPHLNRPG